ncbi:hypothetical protein BKA62DRAFT_826596, partial [Auriculariales sp. MPI-PUGE-AT-0066]
MSQLVASGSFTWSASAGSLALIAAAAEQSPVGIEFTSSAIAVACAASLASTSVSPSYTDIVNVPMAVTADHHRRLLDVLDASGQDLSLASELEGNLRLGRANQPLAPLVRQVQRPLLGGANNANVPPEMSALIATSCSASDHHVAVPTTDSDVAMKFLHKNSTPTCNPAHLPTPSRIQLQLTRLPSGPAEVFEGNGELDSTPAGSIRLHSDTANMSVATPGSGTKKPRTRRSTGAARLHVQDVFSSPNITNSHELVTPLFRTIILS